MQLVPNVAQLVYSTIAFLVLLGLLSRFAYPPVVDMLEKRQATIRESLERAEETRVEAERLLQEYKKQIAEARAEAHEISEQGRKVGESMKEDIVGKAREEANSLVEKAREEITAEKRKALDEVTERVADLTVAAASKVVSRALDEADHKRLIEEYLQEIGPAK